MDDEQNDAGRPQQEDPATGGREQGGSTEGGQGGASERGYEGAGVEEGGGYQRSVTEDEDHEPHPRREGED